MGIYTSRHPIARLGLFNRLFLGFVRLYCRLGVEGLEHVPRGGGFVLVANHSSHVDTAVIFAALPASMHRRVAAAAAQDYFFDDGLRQCVSRILFNVIPVPRNVVSGKDPLRHVVRAIREGYGVLLFPEGTRNRSGELGPFQSGIGRLAAEFPDAPIVPVWIEGTARVLPKNALVPRPARVHVRFGPPVEHTPAGLGRSERRTTWRLVANEVRDAVAQLSPRAAAGAVHVGDERE